MVAFGLVVTIIATARLAVVVSATPRQLWFVEYPRLFDMSESVAPSLQSRADALAVVLSDPALFHARQAACVSAEKSGTAEAVRLNPTDRCMAAIDDALNANPLSGELWLLKSQVAIQLAGIGESVFEPLRRSYQTTPREGWIAGQRVLVGLRLYPLLPADIQKGVLSDLEIVLTEPQFAEPLAEAYKSDLTLRRAAGEALRALPPNLLNRFVDLVQNVS